MPIPIKMRKMHFSTIEAPENGFGTIYSQNCLFYGEIDLENRFSVIKDPYIDTPHAHINRIKGRGQ